MVSNSVVSKSSARVKCNNFVEAGPEVYRMLYVYRIYSPKAISEYRQILLLGSVLKSPELRKLLGLAIRKRVPGSKAISMSPNWAKRVPA